MPIPFIDLQAQRERLGQPLEDAILRVVRSGAYIMGPEIGELEAALGAFGQAPHVLTCGSGTEALVLPLMAWEIGPGDAVFCPSFTFAATAEAMPLVGASPVFVDIDPDTYNMDAASLEAAIAAVVATSAQWIGRVPSRVQPKPWAESATSFSPCRRATSAIFG